MRKVTTVLAGIGLVCALAGAPGSAKAAASAAAVKNCVFICFSLL